MLNFLSKFSKISKVINGKRIYLDYASITPVDKRVLKHVSKISKEYPANPSSLYIEGVQASKELEKSRIKVATHIEAHADEIIFTSGGTESNNLAIQGVLKAFLKKNQNLSYKPHIISTEIEHPSVREILLQYKEQDMCDVTFLPINKEGIVDLKELKKALRPETILVSVMYVNNEIGTIQPIAEVSKIVRHYKKERTEAMSSIYPYVHTDACQAVLFCPLRIPTLGVDMMTLDSAKFYGPRSVGALYVKRNIIQSKSIVPIQIGGSQELDLRAGTENVAGISGFAYAFDIAVNERKKESMRLAGLRDSLLHDLKKAVVDKKIPEIIFNGSYDADRRVPNNINICVPGIDAEYAVLRLDVRGICISSVTSCRSKKEDSSSYVVEALDLVSVGDGGSQKHQDCGKSSLRITLGRFTKVSDVARASKIIIKLLQKSLTHMI